MALGQRLELLKNFQRLLLDVKQHTVAKYQKRGINKNKARSFSLVIDCLFSFN